MDQNKRKILLLDVCHTLYSSNTTFDFLAWRLKDDIEYQALAKKRSSIHNRIRARLGFQDEIRELAVGFLTGLPLEELDRAAMVFAETLTPIQEVMNLLTEYKTRGFEPILLSSSLDFIVSAVAKRLGIVRFHATELHYQDKNCLGTIKKDLLKTKADLIKTHYADAECVFVTDNRTDLACASEVSTFIAVYSKYDSRSARFWRRHAIMNTLTYD